MFAFEPFLTTIIERGLIFSLVVAGVYVSTRIIKFDDLTVEGSFGIGGAIMATAIAYGHHPLIALICALCCGGLAGATTALLHTRLKLNNLISGIVVSTALFSINLKVASAHKDISKYATFFSLMPNWFGEYKELVFLVALVCCIFFTLKWFLQTEVGFLLYAVGQNPQMLINLNKNPNQYLLIALILSNMLTAVAGALFVQHTTYFSIWSNIGILVISLIGLTLGELISTQFGFALVFGAIAYQAILQVTYVVNIDQDWNKLINALFIIILMIFNHIKNKKFKGKKHART